MAGLAAKGTLLQYENPAATWNTIPGLKEFDIPSDMADLIDATDHSSPGGRKEWVAGLIDSDEFQIPINFNPDSVHHQYLRDAVGSAESFKITLTNSPATTIAFSAIVRSFGVGAPVDGIYNATLVLKRTGANTWVDGT